MPRPKLMKRNRKDHKVTVRLDNATYESLKEAMERGTISNLSEALRTMIREKIWEERMSEELSRDLRPEEVSNEDLRSAVDILLGSFDTPERREFLKLDGFLKGFFSALGGVMKTVLTELERREGQRKITKS